MIDYVIQAFVFVVLTADIIVAVTANVRNAWTIIRRLRYCVYSITPPVYVIMIVAVWALAEIFDSDLIFAMVMILTLVAGCCIAYAERFFTRRKTQKRRIPAKRVKKIRQEKG